MRRQEKLYLVLPLAATMLFATNASAEVIEKVMYGGTHFKVLVEDDPWQPDEFDTGVEIAATFVSGDDITIDGIEDDAAWLSATEVNLPMSHGSVESLSIKALYTDSDVILRLRWPDATENREYHPWVWNEAAGEYEQGPQADDGVLFNFEAGCDWFPSYLSGYEFDFDGWHWTAGRSDPAGLAVDISGSIKGSLLPGTVPYPVRKQEREWNLKFEDVNDGVIDPNNAYSDWHELDRKYENWPIRHETVYFMFWVDGTHSNELVRELPLPVLTQGEAAVLPRYELKDWQGNADDVRAKGHWEDGYWTVELRRKRLTEAGLSWDVQFERLTQFSLHVFDGTDRLDLTSESPRLYLKFLPPETLLVSE